MNKISKFGLALLATCVSAATFSSCDDWVEPENVDLNYDTADKTDPVAYEEYLSLIHILPGWRRMSLLHRSPLLRLFC